MVDSFEAVRFAAKVKDVNEPSGKTKPWGREIRWADIEGKYTGKILYIRNGAKLSRQYHDKKTESMLVLFGLLHLEYENKLLVLKPGDSIDIKPGEIHRAMAMQGDVAILEVSTWDDGDVVRIDDEYGRQCATI